MRAYLAQLNAAVAADAARGRAKQEETWLAKIDATRTRLVPLADRLKALLSTLDAEVLSEGVPLKTLQGLLRGRKGGAAHCGELGTELRRLGWTRVRRWRKGEDGFKALWFPPGLAPKDSPRR